MDWLLVAHRILRKFGSSYRIFSGQDSISVRDFIARKYLKGEGIEVGALDNPMATPPQAHVRYVDRMSNAELFRQYPELVNRKLVPVDFVTDGEELGVIKDASQDFVIGNHFFEHCENSIGTLKNFLRVVKLGGILFLVIPDQRFTFDRDRTVTTYSHILEDYLKGPLYSREQHFQEWVQLVENISAGEEQEKRIIRLIKEQYSIHFHTFTPNSFLAHLMQLHDELRFPFTIEAFLQNKDEFICILRKSSELISHDFSS